MVSTPYNAPLKRHHTSLCGMAGIIVTVPSNMLRLLPTHRNFSPNAMQHMGGSTATEQLKYKTSNI